MMREDKLVNSRIAGRLVDRALKIRWYIDDLLLEIAESFGASEKKLFKILTSGSPKDQKLTEVSKELQTRIGDLQYTVFSLLKRVYSTSYNTGWRVFAQEIPQQWLWSIMPLSSRIVFEAIRPKPEPLLIFSGGLLSGKHVFENEEDELSPINIPLDLVDRIKLNEDQQELIFQKALFPPSSREEIEAFVKEGNWEDRISSLSSRIGSAKIVASTLIDDIAEGKNVDQIRKSIEPLVKGIRSAAQRIARTEAGRIAEQTNRRTWENLGDLLHGAQILAILDERTRPEHATRNGRIYSDQNQPGQQMEDLPILPDAPNCRCITTPVLTMPDSLKGLKANSPLISGDSEEPDPSVYQQWFSGVDVKKQKQVVGAGRFNFVKKALRGSRKPEWADFVDTDGRLLSVDTMKAEAREVRQKRINAVRQMMEQRRRDLAAIKKRGFLFKLQEPTQVEGITYSGKHDPGSALSILGELVRREIHSARQRKGGELREKQVRDIGSMLRQAMQTKSIADLQKEIAPIRRELEMKFQLRDRIKHHDRIRELIGQLMPKLEELGRLRQERFLQVMGHVRDMGPVESPRFRRGSDSTARQAYLEAQQFFPSDWLKVAASADSLLVSRSAQSMSLYDHSKRRMNISPLTGFSGSGVVSRMKSTIVHEMFHQFEDLVDGVVDVQSDLYKRRTKKSKSREMSWAPGSKIFIRRDNWFGSRVNGNAEYMGREYLKNGKPIGYEIGTMAMQGLLFGDDPIENDLEVYDALIGMLAAL